jgi:hypothetical protein
MRAALIALGVAALAADVAELPVPLRAPVVLSFLLIGPGYLIVRRLDVAGPLRWVLVVATSLSMAALCGEGLAIAGFWTTTRLLGILLVLTAITPARRHP